MPKKQLTYRDAGLDLDAYNQAMGRLPALMKKTHTPRVVDLPGGFAGLFRLGRSKKFTRNYRDPLLVASTDGVGTKLKVAGAARLYNTVGIDLVAMSVNDCLCLGAEPLFFLDYLALSKDDPDRVEQLVEGVCAGCREAGCALLGGETAIMPDLYAEEDFDLAGFCVGVVERKRKIDGARIRPGDVLLGLASSGLHSNGYSLARKAVFETAGLAIDAHIEELNQTVAQALLTPTRIYTAPVLELLRRDDDASGIRGLAHITGGGIAGNVERIIPERCRVTIDRGAWEVPEVFNWVARLGNINREEMFRVFNMGIGFILVVRERAAVAVQKRLARRLIESRVIGRVLRGKRQVEYVK
jgi:phosphoribosylformylglycinamidine cyclo-ligase